MSGLLALTKPELGFIALGAIFMFMGIGALAFLKKIHIIGVPCTGKIVGIENTRRGHKTPVVEFEPTRGHLICKTPHAHASTDFDILTSSKHLIGKEVPILYDPEDPEKFVIEGKAGSASFVFVIFIIAGIALIVIGCADLLGYLDLF